MATQDNQLIEQYLIDCGIKYQSTKDFIQTFWMDRKGNQVIIVLFINDAWITISSNLNINLIKNFPSEKEKQLEYLNNTGIRRYGLKFLIDKLNHFLILYQIPINFTNSEFLGFILRYFMEIINDLYI
jgi:hypothetical protein